MLISVVGKSGAGKTTIIKKHLEFHQNFIHIDIDKISHQSLEEKDIKERLIEAFGVNIENKNKIDRKKLAKIVFSSKEAMQKLTDITWPFMETRIDELIAKNSGKNIILDWQLLPKTKYFKQSDFKILVTAPFKVRLARALERDKITKERFIERENASLDFSAYEFDYVINNTKEDVPKVNRRIALYPGSFDPPTYGHMNVIKQASNIFDEVIIAVMKNETKKHPLFTIPERITKNIQIVSGANAAIDVALQYNCQALIRGLRGVTDFEYELQLATINRKLSANKISTVCLFPDNEVQYISSSVVKSLTDLDKDISGYVHPHVKQKLLEKKGIEC